MSSAFSSSYDEIPYGNHVHAATHPDNLATVATLSGLTPPPIHSCRVLELGCGSGGNLISTALTLPESQFVGIELSKEEVAKAIHTKEALGLRNVEIRAEDLMSFQEQPGSFDYIIAHGIYSWVPPAVQDRILQICSQHLTSNGIAYISYNTLPGWHLRGMVREMISFHARASTSGAERLKKSRDFLEKMPQAFPEPGSPFAQLLIKELTTLKHKSDGYLFHEHLEEENQPCYFSEFLERAEAQRLQFIDEARPNGFEDSLPPAARQQLTALAGDRLEREQYLDFLYCRSFRRSLLTHQGVGRKSHSRAQALRSLQIVGKLSPVRSNPDLPSAQPEAFRSSQGQSITTNDPTLKTALVLLDQSAPCAVPFESLWAETMAKLSLDKKEEVEKEKWQNSLAEMLLRLYRNKLIELQNDPMPFVATVSEKPWASPLARLWAAQKDQPVINLRQRQVLLSPCERKLIQLFNGKHDRQSLMEKLDSEPLLDLHSQGGSLLEEQLEASLNYLAANALLIG